MHGTELNFAQIQNYTIPIITSIQGILQAYRLFSSNYLQDSIIAFRTIKNRMGKEDIW